MYYCNLIGTKGLFSSFCKTSENYYQNKTGSSIQANFKVSKKGEGRRHRLSLPEYVQKEKLNENKFLKKEKKKQINMDQAVLERVGH